MSTIYIEEYGTRLSKTTTGTVPIPGTLVAAQKITVAGSSAASSAFNAATNFVALTSDVDCQWEEGTSPTADGDSQFLPAGVPRFFAVTAAQKIAVIVKQ